MTGPEARRRQHAIDITTGDVGEVMHIERINHRPVEIWLRPPGGGREWTALAEDVRIVQDEQEQP